MFTAREIIDAACDQTGLDNFGDDYFREGLERLVKHARTDVRLNETGVAALRGKSVDYLVNRLEIEDWYTRHPEIDEEEIIAPVFGLGLPRTGSTVLQCLMAEDPAARSLRTWESEKPCPPPETATQDTDPRIAAMEAAQAGFSELVRRAPELLDMLPLQTVKDPTECQDLVGLSFRSQAFVCAIMFGYQDWMNGPANNMEPAYRYHKRVLKLLQWRCPPKRWRLKSPVHMLHLSALTAVYPDARFVVTHRDVVDSIPSMATLIGTLGGLFVDNLDCRQVGAETAERWRIALDRMDTFRDQYEQTRFFDVGFRRAQAEPFAVMREMYAWLGEDFTPAYETRMQAWRAAHPKGKERGTKIDFEKFGLSPDSLRQSYRRYLDRYRGYIAG